MQYAKMLKFNEPVLHLVAGAAPRSVGKARRTGEAKLRGDPGHHAGGARLQEKLNQRLALRTNDRIEKHARDGLVI